MARKSFTRKREILPDTKYGDKLLTQFIGFLMKKGKRSTAERIIYSSLEIIEKKTDILLWWHHGIPVEDMAQIVEGLPLTKNFLFNWDDPHDWSTLNMETRAKYFEAVFISSRYSVPNYLKAGSGRAIHLPPGYDPARRRDFPETDR